MTNVEGPGFSPSLNLGGGWPARLEEAREAKMTHRNADSKTYVQRAAEISATYFQQQWVKFNFIFVCINNPVSNTDVTPQVTIVSTILGRM